MYFYLVDNVKKCFVTFLGKSLFKSHFSKTTLVQITEEVACYVIVTATHSHSNLVS